MTFVAADGTRHDVAAPEGTSVLDVAHANDLDLEGACEGSMACSTCHVFVAAAWFDKLPAASEEEEDMLDLAFDVRRTSRLGCQIILDAGMDGLEVALPTQHYNRMGR